MAGPGEVDADLVVGADGLRSVVRSALWPDVRPVHRGYTVWRALIGRNEDGPETAHRLTETWGRGVRFGSVPVGSGSTYVYAVAPTPADDEDELARLHRLFGGWHDPVPTLLDRVEPGSLLRHDVHDIPPGATPLVHGRHALAGDAAHAMEPNLGQGACLALEDAVVLAHSLATSPSIETGLAGYARARAPRVTSLARRSRQVGRLAGHAHPWGTAVRDAAMLATPDWVARRGMRDAADWQPPVCAPAAVEASAPG